jgi:hypothetical protein
MDQMGISGLSDRKYDLTMCTYYSAVNGAVLTAIAMAWKGKPWEDVEILTGKSMAPTPGKKKIILLGKCIYQGHKNNNNRCVLLQLSRNCYSKKPSTRIRIPNSKNIQF